MIITQGTFKNLQEPFSHTLFIDLYNITQFQSISVLVKPLKILWPIFVLVKSDTQIFYRELITYVI